MTHIHQELLIYLHNFCFNFKIIFGFDSSLSNCHDNIILRIPFYQFENCFCSFLKLVHIFIQFILYFRFKIFNESSCKFLSQLSREFGYLLLRLNVKSLFKYPFFFATFKHPIKINSN